MHTKLLHSSALLALLLVLLPLATAATSLQEGIHLVRPDSKYITDDYAVPEYLTVEDLTFISCVEGDYALQNSVLCLDDNSFQDLQTVPWTNQDNCYLSSFNLNNFQCEHLVVQAAYTKDDENYKLTKNLRVNKLSKVLDEIVDTQYSDGGWQDPLSTAYAIWSLSYFKDIYDYEINLALDWLKLNRNDDEKCWPTSPCNVEMSADVLALLNLSNYTDTKRVVNDGTNWLEELQNNYEQGDEWTVAIEPTNNYTTVTLVSYDGTILDEDFYAPTQGTNYTFKAYEGKKLIVIADDHVYVDIYNKDGDLLADYQGDNLTYVTPGPCWSVGKKGEPCDSTVSIYALTTSIDQTQKDLGRDWAREQLHNGEVLGKYYGDGENTIADTALYLYDFYTEDQDESYMTPLINWLLYTQNNEGSWGENDTANKSVPTALSVLALTKAGYNRTDEPIKDAEHWASAHEADIPENDTIALASTFFVLKHNARPLLTSNPKIIVVNQSQLTIQIFNPTTFAFKDLTYNFSDGLDQKLSIEQKEDLDAYSYRRLKITRTSSTTADVYGYLNIANLGDPIAKIPVILSNAPTLNVTPPESVTIFGKNGELKLAAKKSSHTFICTVDWNGNELTTPGSVKLTGATFTIPLSFSQALTKEDVYTGELSCAAAGKTVKQQISVYITRYAAMPLTITPEDLVVNDTTTDPTFVLTNNLDRDLTVTVAMDRYGSYFGFRDTVTLDPNEQYNFTLTNNLPADLNLTSTALIQFTVFDKTTSASMLIDVAAAQPTKKSFLQAFFPFLVGIIIIAVIAYLIWKFRDALIAELNKLNFWRIKQEKKKENKRISTLKKEEHHQAIINLFNIMKFQGKDEKEIAQRLIANFPQADVEQALEQAGIPLNIIEEPPEKAT